MRSDVIIGKTRQNAASRGLTQSSLQKEKVPKLLRNFLPLCLRQKARYGDNQFFLEGKVH